MKIKYKHQRFQTEAARCVTDAFRGQPKQEPGSNYLIDQGTNKGLFNAEGYANLPLLITDSDFCENIRKTQMEQGIKPIDRLEGDGRTLTVEMETGTGKTYTYIKTMYELNKLYGWLKFIVVVPSIAIREGVLKSFSSMSDHFAEEYGKRMEYFVYNSKKLEMIDHFSQSSNIHVMIINTQAFNASMNEDKNQEGRGGDAAARIIFTKQEKFMWRRPIDVIAKNNPIMIIDEPQSVLGADKGNATRKGIAKFNPLFKVLYSATHRKDDIQNMVFRLDAIDAYNRQLVKKIEVRGIRQVGTTATNGFVYLDSIVLSKGNPQARISYDISTATGTRQSLKLMKDGDDLYDESNGLEEYRDRYKIERIDGREGTVRFLNGLVLHEGDAVGVVNEDLIRRIQIRETIRTHLERERQLFPKKIKVLSLFFIDHVESYRKYGEGGTTSNGKYAEMFEQEYQRCLKELLPELTEGDYVRYLQDPRNAVDKIHDGYFSKDKKGNVVDSKAKEGENEERGFNLIMKEKEKLLDMKTPVRFIFSHSALKEGWDNPNVFQICTLKDTTNEIKKRQEVGRGMRLCVNAKGERQDSDVLGQEHVFDTNVLTVVASESYEDFADKLQKEIAEACQNRPTVVTPTLFAGMKTIDEGGNQTTISVDKARTIHEQLIRLDYLENGQLTKKYFDEKRGGNLDFGSVNDVKTFIVKRLELVYNPEQQKPGNSRNKKTAKLNTENFAKREWLELWSRINKRTYYNVSFESADLVKKAVEEIDNRLFVTEVVIRVESGKLEKIADREQLETATAMEQGKTKTIYLKEAVSGTVKYDLVGELVQRTGLTRRTIVNILKGIKEEKFQQFRMNPEDFIGKVSRIVNDCKALSVIEHIKYEQQDKRFSTDIFAASELSGVIGKNAIESKRSLYDLVVVDSEGVEMEFAKALENDDSVVVYTKLPREFYISTPMGKYNPDWAIAFKEGAVKHIYFVVETKGNELDSSQLRGAEDAKIKCARKHFESISTNDVIYTCVKTYKNLTDVINK